MSGTVIGPSFVLEGDVDSDEGLEVLGTIRGKRVVAKTIAVAGSGTVEAEIDGDTVRVEGKVVGDINASARVEIAEDSEVHGDIRSPRVLIADGAQYRGNVDMNRG